MAKWEIVNFAETFSVQPVVTKLLPGDDYADRREAVMERYGQCTGKLRYGEGDFRYFGNKLATLLREHGGEPEVGIPPPPDEVQPAGSLG